MHGFGERLGQAVSQQLGHDGVVVVARSVEFFAQLLQPDARRHGEAADPIAFGGDEVRQQLDEIQKQSEYKDVRDVKVIDPCMGSGHILVYLFDVLVQIYESYGYTTREAVESIVKNNLYGLDIDDRAAQLAYFAVMMKARQYDRRFFSRQIQPNVYAIQESNGVDRYALEYFCNGDSKLKAEMDSIITEMHDAKEYGSILNITPVDFAAIYARFDEVWDDISMSKENVLNSLLPLVQVAEAMAQKYDLKKGDSIILSDEEDEMDYAFQVADITQYSSGLYAFMDIDSMRDLFQTSSDYYNMVVSKKKLSIDSGKLYATTSKKAIEESSDVFINMMIPMMGMIVGLSVIIFAIVMYLMIKVMIDRSAQNIALMKVFGYRKKEIKKLYLDGNFYMIAVGALISVPLSKKLMDAMYPVMVSNIACGMNLSFTWQMYALIYAGIIITYLVINKLLVRKIYKVGLSDALKNRE